MVIFLTPKNDPKSPKIDFVKSIPHNFLRGIGSQHSRKPKRAKIKENASKFVSDFGGSGISSSDSAQRKKRNSSNEVDFDGFWNQVVPSTRLAMELDHC